jgi:hypothetical protein
MIVTSSGETLLDMMNRMAQGQMNLEAVFEFGEPDMVMPYVFRMIRLWPIVIHSTTPVHQLSLRLCSSLLL